MSQSRQLAAIMFTDIVGYTALMGRDEKKAFEFLKKNRELQKPVIEKYQGLWIKELGDGVLASFNNVSDAIHAAIEIQEKCAASGEFELRIGVHQGDVVFESDDVFGDAVNIASRIQGMAAPGSIYISESVQLNISSLTHIDTRFVKNEVLKNVREPLNIYEVVLDSREANSDSLTASPAAGIQEKSIAVLPFANMSNDPEQEYFSDGIAEEIINSLVHIKDLKIAGRTSSAQFKGKQIDLREIGKKLCVANVLEGSIRKQGNRVRITAQLIDVNDGFQMWSEKYDRDIDDIFAIQDEIAFAITEKLKITLFEKDRETITRSATHNTEAYELVLKGRFHTNRRGRALPVALGYFKQAIEMDPQYGLAYAGYAWANYLLAFYGFVSGKAVMDEIKNYAERAIQLDSACYEGYSTLAAYYDSLQWDWEQGKKHYLKAIEINPQFAQGNSLYGLVQLAFIEGKFEAASQSCRLGLKADPLSAIDYADYAWTLYCAGHFTEGLDAARMGVELDANSFLSHRLAGLCLIELNRAIEAIDLFNQLLSVSNRQQHALTGLIWAHCAEKNMEQAQWLMDELIQRKEKEYIGPFYAGISAAHLNHLELAFEFLEQAITDRDPTLIQIKYNPFVPEAVRADPRFKVLMNRLDFPG